MWLPQEATQLTPQNNATAIIVSSFPPNQRTPTYTHGHMERIERCKNARGGSDQGSIVVEEQRGSADEVRGGHDNEGGRFQRWYASISDDKQTLIVRYGFSCNYPSCLLVVRTRAVGDVYELCRLCYGLWRACGVFVMLALAVIVCVVVSVKVMWCVC